MAVVHSFPLPQVGFLLVSELNQVPKDTQNCQSIWPGAGRGLPASTLHGGRNAHPCRFGDHGRAGGGYLLACCTHLCWKGGVHETALEDTCSLWQCLCGRLLTNLRDLVQRGDLRTLQTVISLSAGRPTPERACLLPRRRWLEIFRAIPSFSNGAERTLCVRDRST